MDIKSEERCLFCGSPPVDLQRGASADWSEACVRSLCCLFRVPPSPSAILEEAPTCASCLQLIRDIDFNIRLLSRVVDRLEKHQAQLLTKINQNYDKVSTNSSGSYHDRVKIIAEAFSVESSAINVDRFKNLLNFSGLNQSHKSANKKTIQRHPGELVQVKIEAQLEDDTDFLDYLGIDLEEQGSTLFKTLRDQEEEEEEGYKNFANWESNLEFDDEMKESKEGIKVRKPNTKRKYAELPTRASTRVVLKRSLNEESLKVTTPHKAEKIKKVKTEKPKPYHCDQDECAKSFSSTQSLRQHKLKRHNEGQGEAFTLRFPCSLCSIRFRSEQAAEAHRRRVHEDDPTPHHCSRPNCGKKYSQLISLQQHERFVHVREDRGEPSRKVTPGSSRGREVPIPIRDSIIQSWREKMTHMEISEKYSLPRSTVGTIVARFQITGSVSNRKGRGRKVTLPLEERRLKTLPCSLCSELFRSTLTLKSHRSSVHAQEIHLCSICQWEEPTLPEKERHEALHHASPLPFQCVLCEESTISRNSVDLRRHVRDAHDSNSGPVLCDTCGVSCSNRKALKRHLVIHRPSYTPHPCTVCGFVCKTNSLLKQHMSKHINARSHLCDICGRGFNYPKVLKDHRATHEGRSFSCNLCSKTFVNKRSLLRHEETHSGAADHGCRICGKMFKAKISLIQHERQIHGPVTERTPRVDGGGGGGGGGKRRVQKREASFQDNNSSPSEGSANPNIQQNISQNQHFTLLPTLYQQYI